MLLILLMAEQTAAPKHEKNVESFKWLCWTAEREGKDDTSDGHSVVSNYRHGQDNKESSFCLLKDSCIRKF